MTNSSSISGLGDDALAHVTSYLPRDHMSRLLLAAALTGIRGPDRRRRAKGEEIAALLPESRGRGLGDSDSLTLDFATLDSGITSRLTDDDLRMILACKSVAEGGLRKVRLAGCTGIRGDGLDALRGTAAMALEQVDLRVATKDKCGCLGRSVRRFRQVPRSDRMCEEEVLPILRNILEKPGASLRHLRLPKKWMVNRSSQMIQFLELYERHLRIFKLQCPMGDDSEQFEDLEDPPEAGRWIDADGNQHSTCYTCLEDACEGPSQIRLGFCTSCEKHFCQRCSVIQGCKSCGGTWCSECMPPRDWKKAKGVQCRKCWKIDCVKAAAGLFGWLFLQAAALKTNNSVLCAVIMFLPGLAMKSSRRCERFIIGTDM